MGCFVNLGGSTWDIPPENELLETWDKLHHGEWHYLTMGRNEMTQVVIHQWLLQGLDKNYGNYGKLKLNYGNSGKFPLNYGNHENLPTIFFPQVETVGDAYMVAFGLMPEVRDDEDPSLIASRCSRCPRQTTSSIYAKLKIIIDIDNLEI